MHKFKKGDVVMIVPFMLLDDGTEWEIAVVWRRVDTPWGPIYHLLASFIPPWELVPKTHTGVRQRNMPICFDVSNYEESLKNAVRSIIVRWVNSWEGPLNVTVMEKEVSALVRAMGAEWGCFTKGLSFNSCSCAWQRYELMHQFVEPDKRGGDAQVQEG